MWTSSFLWKWSRPKVLLSFREGMFSNVLFRCGQGRQRKREGRGGSQQCWRKLMLFSPSVVSDSLQPHGLQHARLPCPSLSPWACSDSWPMSWWCHPAISSSVTPFYSCPQSFMSRRPWSSFPVSQRFASGGQSIGASASASVLPVSFQGWFPLGLTGLISCARDSKEPSSEPQIGNLNSSALSLLCGSNLTSVLLEKP